MTLPPITDRSDLTVGPWHLEPTTGTLSQHNEVRRMEPKVADLLWLLASTPNQVVPRETIFDILWPDVVVGDEALSRCVSKLRKALGDDPKAPSFIATVPKRGYRLIAPTRLLDMTAPAGEESVVPATSGGAPESVLRSAVPSEAPRSRRPATLAWLVGGIFLALLLAVLLLRDEGTTSPDASQGSSPPTPKQAHLLLDRAHDFYFQFTRADNESAIALYERLIADSPDLAAAQSGLANALVQKVIRWQEGTDWQQLEPSALGQALGRGQTQTETSRQRLQRALALAQRAVSLTPDDAEAHKALGFVHSAMGEPELATASYRRAITIDSDAWGALINLGDLQQIQGDRKAALDHFERAYAAMGRVYDQQAPRVRPWHAALGVVIGELHESLDQPQEAETWYRRVLAYAPLHPDATLALAQLLQVSGDLAGAQRLCRELELRVSSMEACRQILTDSP